jgi:hypothetical protein
VLDHRRDKRRRQRWELHDGMTAEEELERRRQVLDSLNER